jgi:hypothetical protein
MKLSMKDLGISDAELTLISMKFGPLQSLDGHAIAIMVLMQRTEILEERIEELEREKLLVGLQARE